MKYSGIIGVAAIAILIYSCTMVWVTIPVRNISVGGFHSTGTDYFGRPGLMITLLCAIAAVFFLVPRLWAKRANVFVCALNFAWSVAKFYQIGVLCRYGDCPVRQTGIYIMLFSAIVIFIMGLLPKLEIPRKDHPPV